MNVYKDFVVLHNMTLDPRDVKLYVDWLLSCESESQAYKIGEAMQAAIDNYINSISIDIYTKANILDEDVTETPAMSKTVKCHNLNYEGECRVTNALCDNCVSLGRLLEDETTGGTEND